MKIFDAIISTEVCNFLIGSTKNHASIELVNQKIFEICGIIDFFETHDEYRTLIDSISFSKYSLVEDTDRAEYGDFQTNKILAYNVTEKLKLKGISPEIVIEPTCGKGNFIVAALTTFNSIKQIYGIEIYKPYIWETKFSILDFFISNPTTRKPEISIIHSSIFDFNFREISEKKSIKNLLILGNPPWVTNSKLGSLNSLNLPPKTNFKKQNGLDAITGKGNFDIAEYITIMLFDAFQYHNGNLALLVKNSVIKNILFEQKERLYKISSFEKHCIDSNKEFDVSVEASLLFCKFNSEPGLICQEYDFYSQNKNIDFGWQDSKFVSNIVDYNETKKIDGICPFEWRQGVKHDCSSIMELERLREFSKNYDGFFINKISQEIDLEESLIYGLLKSSDLKNTVIENTRKYTIITQSKVGQETAYIESFFPKTFSYLKKNLTFFQARKSSIYKGKPQFSIFGIGDYSFKPYKVAISALYKTYHFTLVLPQNDKAVMLDDTCYFIGFDKIEYAVYSIILLNSTVIEEFLKSISFSDAKRVFTKDLLMRIDLLNVAESVSEQEIEEQISNLNKKYELNINLLLWQDFINEMTPKKDGQLCIFE